jgi:uncharacterized SAM-binding protein YcdF (DUF218 family)
MLLWPIRFAFRILSLMLLAIVLYFGTTFVQVVLTSTDNSPHHADAALVFGTAANFQTPRQDLKGRLMRALELYRKGLVPLIAVTGGKLRGDRYTEAQISARWLEQHGVPGARIVLGGGSDTWKNVGSVAKQLRVLGVKTVLVVTDSFHEDRAMAIVSDYGFSPSPTPSQHSPIGGLDDVGFLAKEAAEISIGRIIGYGTLASWLHT